jgi:hypothetical protein
VPNAIAVERSKNTKTGPISATYAAQGSCPTSCPLLHSGCYAESGQVGMLAARLAAKPATPRAIARQEAAAIDTLTGALPLRLHVVGDCRTDATTRIVSAAADRYAARHDQPVWTYTHAWRAVDRDSWGAVSVRASCESVGEIPAATARGYRAAVIVSEHPTDGRAWNSAAGKVIPCPAQTRDTTCRDCKLCWTSPHTIAFAAHGQSTKKVQSMIQERK